MFPGNHQVTVTPAGWSCANCGTWVPSGTYHACRIVPGGAAGFWPFPPTHRNYKCPKCNGEFDFWDTKLIPGGTQTIRRCPFCLREVGEEFRKPADQP